MKTKRIINFFIIALMGIGCARGAKVTFQPVFSDVRFQPADKLHAGCSNSASILVAPEAQKITKFTLVMYYNPENIEILRILPNENIGITSSKIEYDKIILDVKNPIFASTTQATSFFQLYFKSKNAGTEIIRLGTGSEATTASKIYPLNDTFTLDFEQVSECEPDVIPPSISLVYPKDTQQRISLDQYFVFDIKDIGKGVDKQSSIVHFDGEDYAYGSENLKRNGNYLVFYPSKWIPIDKKMNLKISVADQQIYGGPNTTESTYNFQTATGMVLNKGIDPMLFRKMAQEAEKISASVDECSLLANFYTTTDIKYQQELTSIIQKLGCDLSMLETPNNASGDNQLVVMNTQQKEYRNISVFATIGRILFFIAFTLKMHYLLSYRKHKKINEMNEKYLKGTKN